MISEGVGTLSDARGVAPGDAEYLDLVLEAAEMGTWDFEIPANRVTWSSNIEGILGLAPGSFDGTSEGWFATIHPDHRPEMAALMERTLGEGSGFVTEYRGVGADGQIRWIAVRARVRRGAAGEPLRLVGVAADITARKQTDEDLRDSQRFLDSVIEHLPTMVFVKDAAELRFVRLNRAGEELLGYSNAELVGKNDYDFFPEAQADFFIGKDRDVLDNGRLVDIPAERIETRVKGQRILHTRKIPLFGDAGQPVYLLGISEDITEQVEAEEALARAREEVDAASRAKTEFLSRMSHELRTPLNAVLGFGQLLELDELSTEQRDSVEHIARAGRHLLEMIDEVLDISRVESGELRLSLEPVSLHDVVGEAVGMVKPLASARGVRVNALVDGDAQWHVRGDRQRLKQVAVNLLANAVKYNRDGGEVSVVYEPTGGGRIRLVVADTGIGIAENDLARLFLPFERFGAAQSEVEGTGLGLTLTKHLVEAMGGEIGATSQPGVGSSFWVELPMADAPGEQPEPTVPVTVAAAPSSARARTVLYVEDNLSNVRLVERVVARRPEVTLLVAMQGRIALDLAREHAPSLILLDLHLPDVPGEEVLRRLRADPRTSATPVVVLSADATSGQRQRLRAHGATDYLTKPFDIPRLLAVIDGNGSLDQPNALLETPSDRTGWDPLDPTVVASLRELEGDSAVGSAGIRDLVRTFLDDSESRFTELRTAVRDGDVTSVERLAHTLVGSSASFGARDVAERCREIEARAMAGDVAGVATLLAGLDEAFALARAALRAEFLPGGDPSP